MTETTANNIEKGGEVMGMWVCTGFRIGTSSVDETSFAMRDGGIS
jgi:hypothetical protein